MREPTLCCVAYLRSGLLIAGTSRGEIWSWAAGGELVSRLRVHAGPVFTLQCHPEEDWVLSGGKDGRLRLWGPAVWERANASAQTAPAQAAPVRMLDLRSLAAALTDVAGRPRLLGPPCLRAIHWVGERMLVGTRAGELSWSTTRDRTSSRT